LADRTRAALIVTLNRPEAKNALSSGMLAGMYRAWRRLDDDADFRVAILTGRGDVFCGVTRVATLPPLPLESPANERRSDGEFRASGREI
jgi:enoyl-CoA hydratase/carnithine racemase